MCELKRGREKHRDLGSSLKITPEFADEEKTIRQKLIVNWDISGESRGKVVAIGYNPGKAGQPDNKNKNGSDFTTTFFANFLDMYGFDNFTMINLIETFSRNTDGLKGKDIRRTNFEQHDALLKAAEKIVIIWGISKDNFAPSKLGLEKDYKEIAYTQRKIICNILQNFDEKKICCLKTLDGKFPVHPRIRIRLKGVSPYDYLQLVTLEREYLEKNR